MGFIYKATYRMSGKAYIGQTIRPIMERLEEHKKTSSGCRAFYAAIKKHGWENFDVEWYEVPDDELNFYEEMLVALLGTLAPGGYNLKEGGGATGKMSKESKQKMSEAKSGEKHPNYGKTLSVETKQKMSEALSGEKNPMYGMTGEKHPMFGRTGENNPMYGKTHTEETKQKLSESMTGEKHPNYGKTHTKESKEKMSEAHRGKTHTEETKQKMSKARTGANNHRSKKVYQYNLDGTYVDSFGSSGEAARAINEKNGDSISRCASGKGKVDAHGFKWSRVPPVSAEHLFNDF